MTDAYEPSLVSVIVPTFNRSSMIGEALKSVLEQSYRPIEIVVVDDGSTDDTEWVVREWDGKARQADVDLTYIYQEKAGAPAARNRALLASVGQYVQYLDSDDRLHPDKLRTHVSVLLQDETTDYVWSSTARLEESHRRAGSRVPQPSGSRMFEGRRRVSAPMQVVSGLYRRRVCVGTGPWNENLPRYQDWEYNVRALSVCRRIRRVDCVGYYVSFGNPDRISATTREKYADQIVHACAQLACASRGSVDRYLAGYMSSQALVSAALIYAELGAAGTSRSVIRSATSIAPISIQKLRSMAYEVLLASMPASLSALTGLRSKSRGNR